MVGCRFMINPPGNEKTYPTKREKEQHRQIESAFKRGYVSWRVMFGALKFVGILCFSLKSTTSKRFLFFLWKDCWVNVDQRLQRLVCQFTLRRLLVGSCRGTSTHSDTSKHRSNYILL